MRDSWLVARQGRFIKAECGHRVLLTPVTNLTLTERTDLAYNTLDRPKWRNGRRGGLKNHLGQPRVGSTPTVGIKRERKVKVESVLCAFTLHSHFVYRAGIYASSSALCRPEQAAREQAQRVGFADGGGDVAQRTVEHAPLPHIFVQTTGICTAPLETCAPSAPGVGNSVVARTLLAGSVCM